VEFIGYADVTITDTVTSNASFSATFPITVSAGTRVTATATDPDGNTSEFSNCRLAVVESDMAISKAVVSGLGKPGQLLIYTITATNNGPGEANSVIVNDAVPQGTTFYSALPAPVSAPPVGAGGTVIWNLGSLNSGASATLTLKVKVSARGKDKIVNTATVTSSTPDPNLANNTATITTKRIVK
jgi:uncharacterized repeat protein (TIGR01451 family)